jgi:hypothetical protein
MADLPWTSRAEMQPGKSYVVMASHLPLRRLSASIRFLRAVLAVQKQLARADGLVGYTLRTKFVQWEITEADGRPSWSIAQERLGRG